MDFLHDVVDGNRSAGIPETTATVVTGSGGKQGAICGQDVETQQSQFLYERNQGMKDLLIPRFSNTSAEIGEGSLTGNPISPKPGPTPIVLTAIRISQNQAEVLDGPDSFQIAKQIEQKKRNRIIAGTTEYGIGIGGNRADEGKIDDGSYQLGDTAADGSVVIDMDKLFTKFIMGKPTSLFLGKRFFMAAVDEGIDSPELSDNITNRELGEFTHLKAPRVSREKLPPSKILPGNPFLFLPLHPALPKNNHPFQTKAFVSSLSTNTGGSALQSFSCT